MARLKFNGLRAALGAGLTSSGTTITFAAALTYLNGTAVPTISGDYVPLALLDPSTNLILEIVYLTNYTSGATTGTITRGREGTTGVAHSLGDPIVHDAMALDFGSLSDGVPYVNDYRNTDQTIATSTLTIVVMSSTRQTQIGITDNGSGTYTMPIDGVYGINASILWSSGSATGSRQTALVINGTQTYTGQIVGSSSVQACSQVSVFHRFSAGDTLSVRCYQNSGGNFSLLGDDNRTFVQIAWIRN